jgi:hypothetical protein
MPKYLYWGFAFVLFRESAPKIIRHYAEHVRGAFFVVACGLTVLSVDPDEPRH